MKEERISFPSSDGRNTVAGYIFTPGPDTPVRGIVQLSHGMIDHTGRYLGMAEVLTGAGYAVASNDHLGHGGTAASREDLGYFGARGARESVVRDLHAMSALAKERFPGAPLVLLGHSMGSFLARMYAVRYGDGLAGLIILGTGGPNPALPAGILVADILTLFRGRRFRSRTLASLAFSGYHSRYGPDAPHNAWLTRDNGTVEEYATDPLCRYVFTVSAYRELFGMTGEVNRSAWYRRLSPSLPVLLASGTMDPVGGYGRGVEKVAAGLRKHGMEHLTVKFYPDARHELFHETNREEFFADLLAWLGATLG